MSRSWHAYVDWPGHRWFGFAARIYLGTVFLLACWHKLAHPDTFALDIATYQLLPLWAVNAFALVLPWIELFAGILLIAGYKTQAAAWLILLMMLSFIIALLWALHLGLDMACGCFASQAATDEDPISHLTLLRDLLWFGLAAYILLFDSAPLGIDRLIEKRSLKQ